MKTQRQEDRETIAAYRNNYEHAKKNSDHFEQKCKDQAALISVLEKRAKELTDQFNDLKTRLLASERACEFMRGYLARVGEDDTVREELVVTGDPSGEQQMVPKRKPTHFPRASDFTEPSYPGLGDVAITWQEQQERKNRKPRHWVIY